jgi:hypothetical protein
MSQMIEKAITSWDGGRQQEAVGAIRKVVAMSKRSPECGAIWQADECRLPEELKRRATRFPALAWLSELWSMLTNYLEETFKRAGRPRPKPFVDSKPSGTGRSDASVTSANSENGSDQGIRPLWVGLAIFFCFPLGLYLLKKHPTLAQNKKWWGVASVWIILGGWVVALYTGVFLLCLLPILVPVGLYLKWRNPAMTFDSLRQKGSRGTFEQVEQDLAGPDGEMKPEWVGLAIFFFFPLGLYLLWKHPTLSHRKTWWGIGGAWSLIVLLAAASGDKDKNPPAQAPAVAQTPAPAAKPAPTTPSPPAGVSLLFKSDLYKKGYHDGAEHGYSIRTFHSSDPLADQTYEQARKEAYKDMHLHDETGYPDPAPDYQEGYIDGYSQGFKAH